MRVAELLRASGVKLFINGKDVPVEITDDKLSDSILNETTFNLGRRSTAHPLNGSLDDVRVYDRVLGADEIASLADAPNLALVRVPADQRTSQQADEMRDFFRDKHYPPLAAAKENLQTARKALEKMEKSISTAMVMSEMENSALPLRAAPAAYSDDASGDCPLQTSAAVPDRRNHWRGRR